MYSNPNRSFSEPNQTASQSTSQNLSFVDELYFESVTGSCMYFKFKQEAIHIQN